VRKVTFGGANSFDNFFARLDHAMDWLLWGDEVAAITADFWKRIDTVLMGRKTYEVAVRNGQDSGYPGVKNYVFSRTLKESPNGVTIVRDDAAEFVATGDSSRCKRRLISSWDGRTRTAAGASSRTLPVTRTPPGRCSTC